MASSPNTMSPSRNSISNWFKLLKKDSSNDITSPTSSTFNNINNASHLDLNDTSSLPNNNSNSYLSYNLPDINISNANSTPSIQPASNTIDHNIKLNLPSPINIMHNNSSSSNTNNNSNNHPPSSRKNSNPLSLNILSPTKSIIPQNNYAQQLSTSPTPTSTPSRPFLGFKSRSSHSFRPLSQFLDSSSNFLQDPLHSHDNLTSPTNSNMDDSSKEKLRSHRDSFLQQRQLDAIGNSSIFGCDIKTSTKLAFGTIYISADVQKDDNDNNVAYGKVPLVIVSCGSFLKANALNVEGIFRLSGSNKRVKQLQLIFSTPPDYGAKIDWDGYTVHDAASLLRRYLGSLSEPLIPYSLYDAFRNPLIEKKELYQYLKEKDVKDGSYVKPDKPMRRLIINQRRQILKEYALLFQKLPPIQHRVLFYLVDMLAMFNLRSDKNRMPAKNLAAIFQPSILFHQDHDMNPDEYASNSLVIEFMITYSHKILVNVNNEASLLSKDTTPPTTYNTTPKDSKLSKCLKDLKDTDDDDDDASEKKIESPLPPPPLTTGRRESRTLSRLGSDNCEKIEEEEVDESADITHNDSLATTEFNDSSEYIKPSIIVESNIVSQHLSTSPSRTMHISTASSPLKGSPLKNVFNPSNEKTKLSDLEAPVTLFSSPRAIRARPHSKSLSIVPHSEVVRIPGVLYSSSSSSNPSNLKTTGSNQLDDSLTRIISNQSGLSSLASENTDITGTAVAHQNSLNIDTALANSSANNLIKELGLSQPDLIQSDSARMNNMMSIESTSHSGSSINVEGSSNRLENTDDPKFNVNTNNIDIPNYIPPITPTTEKTIARGKTLVESHMDGSETNILKLDKDTPNFDKIDSKEDFYSLPDEKRSNISTTSAFESDSMLDNNEDTGKSSNSLPFSFQPSMLQGHQSSEEMNLSTSNRITATTVLTPIVVTPTKNNSPNNHVNNNDNNNELIDFKMIQYSHPDVVNDPSTLRKTATTPSIGNTTASINDEADGIDNNHSIKKRSNSAHVSDDKRNIQNTANNNNNKNTNKSSGLFSMVATHIPSTNLNKNITPTTIESSKVGTREKDKEKEKEKEKERANKEKRTWFDKLRPRSNTKK